jgi:transposase
MMKDNRRLINAVSWIIRADAPDRDLPPEYGNWKNTHRRFCRWQDRDVERSEEIKTLQAAGRSSK